MEKSILTIQQSVLISGLLIALALMIGTYTDRKDRRCDALIYNLDKSTLYALTMGDPNRTRDIKKSYEIFHGITFKECSTRLK